MGGARRVTRTEYDEAKDRFALASDMDKGRFYAIIEAYEKGRIHPDEPGEADRAIERANRRKESAKKARERAEKKKMDRYAAFAEKTRKESK